MGDDCKLPVEISDFFSIFFSFVEFNTQFSLFLSF